MFTVDHSLHLAVPLARVWRLLADVDRYRDWHPFIILKRDPDEPRKITYTYRRRGADQFTVETEISKLDRQRVIAWRVGVRWLLEIEESFVVAKELQGTHLVHGMCCTGCLAFLFWPLFRRGLRNVLMLTDRSLAAHLKRATTIARYSQPRRGL